MMQIEIAARQLSGCTDFIPCPARLHLGSQNAQGVDTLAFALPPAWAGKSVALHIEQADGGAPAPILLDAQGCVAVDRRLTAATSGRWMLTATDGEGYTAYTRPGSYDTCESLPTDGADEPPSATLYEQFVAQVMASAAGAQASSEAAAQAAGEAAGSAAEAAAAATAAEGQADAASASAAQAEAAALRAEGAAPAEGPVLSVNGQGGQVQLDAGDVGALPAPAAAAAGQLLRVLSVDSGTGALATEAVEESSLTGLVHTGDLPTADRPGAIRLGSGYGLALTDGGELRLAPATAAQLAAMADGWAPLAPALLPLAVRLALAAAWESAGWDDDSRAAARDTLGAAASGALASLAARVETLELKYDTTVTEHSFAADLAALDNLTASGYWNAAQARIEF